MFFLFAVMLPVAVWACRSRCALEYAIPRARSGLELLPLLHRGVSRQPAPGGAAGLHLGLHWRHRRDRAVAPLGISWLNKFVFLAPIYNRIPGVLRGVFTGAEAASAATRLLAHCSMSCRCWSPRPVRPGQQPVAPSSLVGDGAAGALHDGGAGAHPVAGGTIRVWGGNACRAATAIVLGTLGIWAAAGCLVAVSAPFWLNPVLSLLGGIGNAAWTTPPRAARKSGHGRFTASRISSLPAWGWAHSAPSCRCSIPCLVAPDFDIAHAHNFFLQTALDSGLPGLLALLAIYMVAVVQIVGLWRC